MADIKLGIIGGSGLAKALAERTEGTRHEVSTPFGAPSDAIVETRWGELPVFVLARHGNAHQFNPSAVPYQANIFALKLLGVTHILATGAVGSLREEMRPRDLVVVDQLIDKTTRRASTFFEQAAVHVEMAHPFCPMLRQVLLEAGKLLVQQHTEPSTATDWKVHDGGCYVCMEGPAFSTRAESLMHRLWGGDLIGMTAMPEGKLAREAEMSYALTALVTDYDSWKDQPAGQTEPAPQSADRKQLLAEIIGNINAASNNGIALLRAAVDLIAKDPARVADAPAHHALELAIWSDKSAIPAEEVERLGPLWKKYFT